MKTPSRSFNIYFTLLCLILVAGCATDQAAKDKKERKKEQSTIRLYLEGRKSDNAGSGTVLVTRKKFPMTIEREPFLDESDLSKAALINGPDGGYAIELVFNDHGTIILDMYTTSNKGKHIVLFSQFPKPGKPPKTKKAPDDDSDVEDADDMQGANTSTPDKPRASAWLTAVLIRDRIPNGIIVFTPDASHAEAVRIVRGLKNVIAKAKKAEKF